MTPDPHTPEYRDAYVAGAPLPEDEPIDLDELLDALVGALGWPEKEDE